MKRRRLASNASNTGARRRSVKACTACRKLKTRCEILDLSGKTIQCHRCGTLNLKCSYEDMDRSLFATQDSTATHSWDQLVELDTRHDSILPTKDPEWTPDSVIQLNTLPQRLWRWFKTGPGNWHFYPHPQESTNERNDDSAPDWSTPLAAIRDLTDRCYVQSSTPETSSPHSSKKDTLENILTATQIQYLLDIFEQTYVPWLNFNLIRQKEGSMLDLICCTIGSRHLNDELRKSVAPSLQSASDGIITKIILYPRLSGSIEAIQALLILALWAPICSNSVDTRDGHLLIASAVSMALNLKLNECPDQLLKAQQSGAIGDHDNDALEELANKARLWLSLTNVDSLLSLGSGRSSLSKRSRTYIELYPLSSTVPTTASARQDLRLRLLGNMLDTMEAAFGDDINAVEPEDIGKWVEKATSMLESMTQLHRIAAPLGVLADHEKPQFYGLGLLSRSCQVLLRYNFTYNAWKLSCATKDDENVPSIFRDGPPVQSNFIGKWARDAQLVTEALFVSLLEMDSRLLATMPDHIYSYISFAAAYIIFINFIVFNAIGRPGANLGDQLILKIVALFRRVACSPDHPANKSALLLDGMVSLWLHRDAVMAHAGRSQSQASPASHCQTPSPRSSSDPSPLSYASTSTSPYPAASSDQQHLLAHPTIQNGASVNHTLYNHAPPPAPSSMAGQTMFDPSWFDESLLREFGSSSSNTYWNSRDYMQYGA